MLITVGAPWALAARLRVRWYEAVADPSPPARDETAMGRGRRRLVAMRAVGRARVRRSPPMSDDWRLTIEVGERPALERLVEAIGRDKLAREARDALGGRVAVTHDGPHLFVYGDSEEQVRAAQGALQPLLTEHGIPETAVVLQRWHPEEEHWEAPVVPMPEESAEEDAREHRREEADDRDRSREQGYPEWEVRLGLPSHHDARALAEQLEGEGIPVTRRWRYVLVGAETEDDARALAQRLREEAPADTELIVEPNGQEVWREMHPYTVLGGLAN